MADPLTEQMVSEARANNPAALRSVYEALAPAVLGYLRSKGCDDPEALAQEVFLTVFAKLAAVRGGAAGLRTFTFSVAHARMVDDLRRRERRPVTVPYDRLADTRYTNSAETAVLESTLAAELLLEGLTAQQREVLLLRVVADLSLEDSAAVMGKTANSVKQLQRRALIALKERIAEKEAEERHVQLPQ
ncbi:RNA polymerase sigma factor [Arthrobacter sp. Sa2CUA1]|uniref:RNA polymerase sigma factor n=1 Tax=Arthrobacter gallicola TaxID=2762225 RepID=A0ABR8UR66_9MICC|nr:RNA polymerase sigma factor [Arthrobacter gallicola]MBD7995036.1 RNA polymerase sigma factor [Arthrobacter gallicola]